MAKSKATVGFQIRPNFVQKEWNKALAKDAQMVSDVLTFWADPARHPTLRKSKAEMTLKLAHLVDW